MRINPKKLQSQPQIEASGPAGAVAMSQRDLTRLGFIFQAFNLVPTLTAEENITLPMDGARRVPDARSEARPAPTGRAGHQLPVPQRDRPDPQRSSSFAG